MVPCTHNIGTHQRRFPQDLAKIELLVHDTCIMRIERYNRMGVCVWILCLRNMYLFLAKNEPLTFSQLLLPTQTLLIKYNTSLKQPSTIDAGASYWFRTDTAASAERVEIMKISKRPSKKNE